MGGQLFAEEKIVTGQFVVSFSAEDDQKAWIVNALEQNIYNDLSGYARVVPFQKVIDEDRICKNRDTDCILEIYKKLNVDALMLGTVDESDIEYEIYDIQNKYLWFFFWKYQLSDLHFLTRIWANVIETSE